METTLLKLCMPPRVVGGSLRGGVGLGRCSMLLFTRQQLGSLGTARGNYLPLAECGYFSFVFAFKDSTGAGSIVLFDCVLLFLNSPLPLQKYVFHHELGRLNHVPEASTKSPTTRRMEAQVYTPVAQPSSRYFVSRRDE